jgi:hypothetical protein
MKKLIFIIIILALVAIVLVIWGKDKASAPQVESTTPSSLNKYTNATYGYSVEYPKNLESREYTAENIVHHTIHHF